MPMLLAGEVAAPVWFAALAADVWLGAAGDWARRGIAKQIGAIRRSCLTINCLLWAALLESLTGSLQAICILRINCDLRGCRGRLAKILGVADVARREKILATYEVRLGTADCRSVGCIQMVGATPPDVTLSFEVVSVTHGKYEKLSA